MTHVEPGPDRETVPTPPAVRGLLYLVCLAAFVTGLWMLGEGVTQENIVLFALGIVTSSLAFMVPLNLPSE